MLADGDVVQLSSSDDAEEEWFHRTLSDEAVDEAAAKVLQLKSAWEARQSSSSLAQLGMEAHSQSQVMTLTLDKPDPNLPQDPIEEQPKSWTGKAWEMYQKAQKVLKPLRGGTMNVAATFAAMGLGPENCLLKLIYILYRHEDEDDYPYLPLHCGAGFIFTQGGQDQGMFR